MNAPVLIIKLFFQKMIFLIVFLVRDFNLKYSRSRVSTVIGIVY